MALDHEALKSYRFADIEQRYDRRDSMLYALGVGCGAASADLPFVYGPELKALPTMAMVLGSPGFWLQHRPFGVDWRLILHGEQAITLHATLPPEGHVVGRYRVEQIVDQGPGRSALISCRRTILEVGTERPLATLNETWVMRGGGGFDGPTEPLARPPSLPDRAPDLSHMMSVSPRAALIYRLSGDFNPLHADPATAHQAGFERPILHGLCTMGIAGRAILSLCCDDDPARLRAISVRFSAPVYPGDMLRIDIWRVLAEIRFRVVAVDREVTVLDNGSATSSTPYPQ